MAKRKRDKKQSSKTQDSKKLNSKKQSDGSAEIQRAEQRLAKALAEVDAGREKVARRERDLAELMVRYGRTAVLNDTTAEAIPLEAPLYSTSTNGGSSVEAESVVDEPVEPVVAEPVEEPSAIEAESVVGDTVEEPGASDPDAPDG